MSVDYLRITIEQSKKYILDNMGKEPIYLGMWNNIVCIDDRLDYKYLEKYIGDFMVFLYLGKIILEKNKQGNFIPKYIPSVIKPSHFEGLNTFWLNERNPNPMIRPEEPLLTTPSVFPSMVPKIDKEAYKYFKNFYFRNKKNIVLSKEQIISYFTQLHTLNTTFIKNYIDSINKNNGITSYYPTQELYLQLYKDKILSNDMFQFWDGKPSIPLKKAILTTLDYLSTNPQEERYINIIPYFDELFYIYFIYSLNQFVVDGGIVVYGDKSGYMRPLEFMDKNDFIFNPGAYKKYYELLKYNIKYHSNEISSVTNTFLDPKNFQRDNIPLFITCANDAQLNSTLYLHGYNFDKNFFSPNRIQIYYNDTLDIKSTKNYLASPLGNYYFELLENKNTFVEFHPRIYPSKANPPQGWSKEMMDKLDLKLE
ncbi:hypothetical protein DCO58_05210 [Helicobacter saguini]|uniref:Uncharacterized protein n=1 Tax=Helicobacter saguini TaxID=1548018 RepID=A0A347W3G1_9HELI|nr:hypothetical protein [Helicobacter saguini]MWV62252.1 hypothetical protein [Helicobacter saguini]MWV67075.1 hypothetical protein [Helicobacter saguini]MWV69425.1 hypothetical protein [Helicobacter saguini]MWV71021.1 hypothetical protein [Helicobacter saguini]TLD91745.1 hypothetical protein LS64_011335 [Helicobacter saguini]